jgi:DNA-binding GntR family transcriptional regulator
LRTKAVFKRAFNLLLNEIGSLPIGVTLGSEPELAHILRVSRTTVRAVLVEAETRGLVRVSHRNRATLRHPGPKDFFADSETESVAEGAERLFLNHVLQGGLSPGDTINGLALSRSLGTSTAALRDYLNRFERFGLVERQPNTSWIFHGFTEEFAVELFVIRELFELHAVRMFFKRRAAEEYHTLDHLETKHRELLSRIEQDYTQFSHLDAEFHREIARGAQNRFMSQFHEVIALVFHYHYQWNKADERERNTAAILEHLNIITALRGDDAEAAVDACRLHLNSAKQTLLRSISVNCVPARFHSGKVI